MRGCITSGEQWVFFVYEKRDDDKGHVSSSNEYAIGPQFEGLALILGLLHDWVCERQSGCWMSEHNYVHRPTTLPVLSRPISLLSKCVLQSAPIPLHCIWPFFHQSLVSFIVFITVSHPIHLLPIRHLPVLDCIH